MNTRAAHVVGTVGAFAVGPYRLPDDEDVTFGRALTCGIQVPESRISSLTATFIPTPLGWVLQNGKRTRVIARSPFVIEAAFGPGARVLLQPDVDWHLSWDFDVLTEITLRYRAGDGPEVRDRTSQSSSSPYVGTALAADDIVLTDLQRRRLVALFGYLIEEAPRPADLLGAASAQTGDTPRQILNTAIAIRDRVNSGRHEQLVHLEDLGYYLVNIAGVIGADDLR